MSFSERMCSCCLVSTMCLFFSIFMAKVLFSSLLSWTCNAEESRSACAITCTFWEPIVKMSKRNHSCYCHSRVLPYQLDTPEATDTQSVDDVEVSQVEIEEKCVLCFIPVVPGKRGKKDRMGTGLEMRWRMKDQIIHFQQPETKFPSLLQLICLQILEDLTHSNLLRMLLRMWSV